MVPVHRPLVEQGSWRQLETHAEKLRLYHLSDLFARDSDRFDSLNVTSCGLTLDVSKQRLTTETLALLEQLAGERQLTEWVDSLFGGEQVNCTEQREAMHWRLRADEPGSEVEIELARMEEMVDRILSGHWRGYLGDSITDVVNIGVGGSDLGPLMIRGCVRVCILFHPWMVAILMPCWRA